MLLNDGLLGYIACGRFSPVLLYCNVLLNMPKTFAYYFLLRLEV